MSLESGRPVGDGERARIDAVRILDEEAASSTTLADQVGAERGRP
jgi:hypothetical protein